MTPFGSRVVTLKSLMARLPRNHSASTVGWLIPRRRAIAAASHNDYVVAAASHNDYVVVDTRGTFAEGKSLREMVDHVGLLGLYRHTYQLLERCCPL